MLSRFNFDIPKPHPETLQSIWDWNIYLHVAILGMAIPPLMTGILIMGPYKPLRTWVDEFIPYDMEIMGV